MRTFAELLTEYMKRTGISDSELARTLGVSRQTIFRWKEGTVERPQHREDVLRCAARLRLTPQERDELLLAAGFSPVSPKVPSPPLPPVLVEPPRQPESVPPARPAEPVAPSALVPTAIGRRIRPIPRLALIVGAIIAILFMAGSLAFLVARSVSGPAYPAAAPGETLVVIGRLANTAQPTLPTETPGGRVMPEGYARSTYDVNKHLQATLEREIRAARLERVRMADWPTGIGDARAAEEARQRAGARTVIWGTSTITSVVAMFATAPATSRVDDMPLDALVCTPAEEMRIRITNGSEEAVQTLALATLSQLYVDRGDFGMARAVVIRALAIAPEEPDTLTALYLDLAYVYQVSRPPELNQAIQLYGQAIDLSPETLAAYLNRGLACVRQNRLAQWQQDFARVLALKPDHAGAHQAFCRAFALDRQPELALPHCDAALKQDTTARSRDARAIVYAQLGRFPEAIADLDLFLGWLGKQPESLRTRFGSVRAEWMQMLKAGINPIDQATLDRLRQE